jgi:hypothetical protein
VDVVSALDESGGESLGEPGGAVDVGREGVGADEDAERTLSVVGSHAR